MENKTNTEIKEESFEISLQSAADLKEFAVHKSPFETSKQIKDETNTDSVEVKVESFDISLQSVADFKEFAVQKSHFETSKRVKDEKQIFNCEYLKMNVKIDAEQKNFVQKERWKFFS